MHVGGVSLDLDVGHLALAQMHGVDVVGLSPHGGAGAALALDRPRFPQRDRLALAGEDELLTLADDAVLGEHQDVGVQFRTLSRT